jgi:hypothetical protein
MSDDGTFVAVYPDGRRVRLRWPMRKQLDDQEYSLATGAQYPRTRRSFLEVLEDLDDDEIGKVQPEKESTMTRTQALHDIAKGGIHAIAKAMTDENRAYGISQHEFTQLMTEHAQRMFPDKTPEGALAKLFCDSGADGVMLRKAHALTKGVYDRADLTPTMVGGPAATHAAVSDTEQSEAYAKLQDMAERMRATSPWLSSEQAFAAVFTDPKNGKLAASAHRRPVATTSFEFPR